MSHLDFEDDEPPLRRQKSKSTAWLIAIFGILGCLLFLLCCGGGIGVVWFGMTVVAEDIKFELRDNPVVIEHLGQLEDLDVDFAASSAIADDNTFIYHARGTEGSGELTVTSITADDGTEEIISGTLRLPSGESFDLFPEDSAK